MTLQQFFSEHPKTAVALSGGTDSAYLLSEARRYGCDTAAIYVKTPFQPAFELADAQCLCGFLGFSIIVIEYDILHERDVVLNDRDRCYHCKKALFTQIKAAADERGFPETADGTNADDDADDRPGTRALYELGILSPLRMCGITKARIREESRRLGLFTADKPSYACLATRIPTGVPVTADALAKVEEAETSLALMGFSDFRVRMTHEGGAVFEIRREQLPLYREMNAEIRRICEPLFGTVSLSEIFRSG